MAHRFNPDRLAQLDNPLRRLLLPARRTLEHLGVMKGDIVIDVGAGSGYFSIPASETVGDEGEVFAVDIQSEAIAIIERKRIEKSRANLHTVLSSETGLGLQDGIATLAFMYTVLHEVEDKAAMLRDLYRALKSGGRIAIVEFGKGALFGPPSSERISEKSMIALLGGAGFKKASIKGWGPSHYAATAVKES
jgi:ubiquinone/menaquinone biosynthesis C-methylase UbiE